MKKLPFTFLISQILLHAMDQPKETVPCIIAWSKNKIFIGNSRACFSADRDTKEETIICHKRTDHIVVNSHKTLVALSNPTLLAIYDTTTLKKIWSKKTTTHNRSAPFFGRKQTIGIFNHKDLKIYDYSTKESYYYKISNLPIPSSPLISYCWQMDELAYASDDRTVILYHPVFPMLVKNCKSPPVACEHCPNGAILAVNKINRCQIYDLRQVDRSYYLQAMYKYAIQSIAFHPNRPILAVLATRFDRIGNHLYNYRDIVQYWNPVRRTLILQTMALNYPQLLRVTGGKTCRLAFSPDGKQLAVSSGKSYHVLDVPDNIFFFIWFVLKEKNLPKELISHIITYMGKTFLELAFT